MTIKAKNALKHAVSPTQDSNANPPSTVYPPTEKAAVSGLDPIDRAHSVHQDSSGALIREYFGDIASDIRHRKPTPFLKWAGGKSQVIDQITRRVPSPSDFGTYFEPFLGGGALFFALLPRRAILSDLNPELINAFQVVRDHSEALMACLDEYAKHVNSQRRYSETKKVNPDELDPTERAARTIYLNKTCYNGLFRVNAKGEFNVPFGKNKNPALYDRENIMLASKALKGKIITINDYKEITKYAHKNDFIYLDPPYDPLSATAKFTGYTKESFVDSDQAELALTFRDLSNRGCRVMLSNSATDSVLSLYNGYHKEKIKARRFINCKKGGRGTIDELLIINY
jgi:DNA adenine methylase